MLTKVVLSSWQDCLTLLKVLGGLPKLNSTLYYLIFPKKNLHGSFIISICYSQFLLFQVQLGESISPVGGDFRKMGEMLLTEAEITQRQLHHQSHPARTTNSSQELGIWSLLRSLQVAQQVGERPFQLAQVV